MAAVVIQVVKQLLGVVTRMHERGVTRRGRLHDFGIMEM
ncbi:hypothetical protein ACVIWU_007640 [Bradyrhizobium sp. USDA 4509]|nr:hypothetical protein [Bradyrhizobium elkanii]